MLVSRAIGRRHIAGIALLALLGSVALALVSPQRAEAISVDATDADFNFDYNSGGNGRLISGGSPTAHGAVVLFDSVVTIDGTAIDAVVTTELSGATISVYDSPGSASSNLPFFQVNTSVTAPNGFTAFTFEFVEHGSYTGPGTGIPVVLHNVSVTSIDIDYGTAGQQFQDFVGYQSYTINDPSDLDVIDQGGGVTRFQAKATANMSNRPNDAVQVTFDSVSTFVAKFGNTAADNTNYFGIAFKRLDQLTYGGGDPVNPAAPVDNPSNQPPTSTDTIRYVVSGTPSTLQVFDFGSYADPDNNPLASVTITGLPTSGSLQVLDGGTWRAVTAGESFPVADIESGRLRYTGTAADDFFFTVNDGLVDSNAIYTTTLLLAQQPQVITFDNPGTKRLVDGSFPSGATSDSGLPVTLESLTPGVCTVSGLNITPVVATGQCTIVATQPGDPDYFTADPVKQTFPISDKDPQVITSPNPGRQLFDGTPVVVGLTPTSDSGLPVTVGTDTPSVCTVSGTDVTILGTGTCTLRHTQPGDNDYAPAPVVSYSFPVVTAYRLTYVDGGADGGTVPAVQVDNGGVLVSGNTGTLTRAGYTFGGWTIGSTTYAGGAAYNLTADATATAIWTAVPAGGPGGGPGGGSGGGSGGGQLAETGFTAGSVGLVGLGLIALGAVVLTARRRLS